ncbi:MAG: hypothetical protein ACTHMH_10970 [Curtobacterium sp.]
MDEQTRTNRLVAGTGVAVVALYAALLAIQALVLDPLAAVPGATLAEIHAHLEREGFAVGTDTAVVVGIALVGVALAVGLGTSLVVTRARPFVTVAVLLGVVALGGPMTWWSGFWLGMDVADAYGVDGGAHTPWAGVLLVTSAIALAAIPFVLVIGQAFSANRARRRTRAA